MSYKVLARAYRPSDFSQVFAQDHITKVLKNAIRMERIAHAYLFTGPRGVGKTSLARIFSKSLNCVNGPTDTPCGVCENCTEIKDGISPDVIEIDGASNTGVDDIRELQRELMYTTSKSKFKIYIIDEVHMLSKNAFNALLKTLEEPPNNVVFIFATTEPYKVLPTIISRCQRFDFKRIPIEAIIEQLKIICEKEKISIDSEAFFIIAKKADGGMRDALSLMDQVLALGHNHINTEDVLSIFGIVHFDVYFRIFDEISAKNPAEILGILHQILETGNDLVEFFNGMLDFARNLLLFKTKVESKELPARLREQLQLLAEKFSGNDLLYMMTYIIKVKNDLRQSDQPVILAELAFIKLCSFSSLENLEELIALVKQGETARPSVNKEPLPRIKPVRPDVPANKIEHLTMELIRQNWVALWERIRKEKPLMGNYLDSDCRLAEVKSNTITFHTGSPTVLRTLKARELESIFSDFFRLPVKVIISLKEELKMTAEPAKKSSLTEIKEQLPPLGEFIEITKSVLTS